MCVIGANLPNTEQKAITLRDIILVMVLGKVIEAILLADADKFHAKDR